MKRIAILQSNYIPWKGYFDLIAAVDEFVFYDEVQYTKNDWRNRNRIRTPHGVQWLSIPVGGSIHRPIDRVGILDAGCGPAHWRRLTANYARAPHFGEIAAWLAPHYLERAWQRLSGVNHGLIAAVCRFLGISTPLTRSSDYDLAGDRNGRLVSLCEQAGATTYVSGPAARGYLDTGAFARAGIDVAWFDYSGYAPYPQLWDGPFVHEVSIVDLLFNRGARAAESMKFAMQSAAR